MLSAWVGLPSTARVRVREDIHLEESQLPAGQPGIVIPAATRFLRPSLARASHFYARDAATSVRVAIRTAAAAREDTRVIVDVFYRDLPVSQKTFPRQLVSLI